MIEQNIIEWLELGDSIQRLDLYTKKSVVFFIMNYLLSQFSHFSEIFYFFIILLFFIQIWELNIVKINVEGDSILKIIKYLEKIFLFHKIINDNDNTSYIILFIISIIIYIISIILSCFNMILFSKKKKKNRFIIATNSILNLLLVYYLHGPSIHILLYKFFCHDKSRTYLCPIKDFWKIVRMLIILIYVIIFIIGIYISTLYINDIGSIKGTNIRCKINNNYTPIIIMIKLTYFIINFFIEQFICDNNNNNIFILIYDIFLLVSNISICIYIYRELFYYNHYINAFFHYGWKYTAWFSMCIFMKNLIKIKDITLFVIFGLIIITMALYFNNKHKYFELITEFNTFEGNNLKNIQIFNHILLDLLKNNDQKSKVLISGVIKRFEEYISNNIELYEQYNKFLNDPHLQKKFTSENELTILSIISIIYSYNIEKSKDVTDITLNMCYFLINRFKNPVYAIWLCTKLKICNNTQSYYRYVLIEDIKEYLISKMEKDTRKLKIKNVQISSAILYNQYVDLFKIKIYEATCSQIDYFDILRNKIATFKTIDNYLRVGEDVLLLRKEVLNLWDKIILLNPFCNESKNDFILYIGSVLQDNILAKNEEKKFYALQDEKLPEKDNIYYSMFNQELSAVLLADGYSFNGKIVYTTPNFPFLFMFSEKEIINTSIDDLLPDIVQNFHKYLIEDAIKNSNLAYIFKGQRDFLLKGKNGIIFNINMFIKPVPNLIFGLIFFIYIKKSTDNNFILILDENLIINGFTEINQMGSDFIWGNNYNLTHLINGHHIGLLIPELLLYLNYDIKTNSFFLPKNSIDLKGYLYPINNFKDFDNRIPSILEELKTRKIMEHNNENKIGLFEEYDELIKILNMQCSKPFSIFFRIELHSFIRDKYIYYRVYIINDLLNGNENIINSESISRNITKKNAKEYLKNTVLSKKIKELKEDININDNDINQDNNEFKAIKIKYINNEQDKNKDNLGSINKNNFNLSTSNKINKNLYSIQSVSYTIQSNAEPLAFNKIKKHIIKKNDCSHVKKMRFLAYIFVPVNIILILFDFFYARDAINKMIEFLQQNKCFMHIKISTANIYASCLNLKLLKKGYIQKENCLNEKCIEFYLNIIKTSITEIKNQKSNIYLFHKDFQEIFKQKLDADIYYDNTTNCNKLNLDMNNFLNLILSNGGQIISYLIESNKNSSIINELNFDIYLKNLLVNSFKYFHSDYRRFMNEDKKEKASKVASHYPICICIYIIFLIYMFYIYYSYIILIKDIHIFYFDKLMNFTSANFELYLKKLDEIKKKFRDDTNEEEDKNVDEFDLRDDIEEKNEYNSKLKNDEKSKKEENINSKSLKKKKQNKIQQQKLKNKRIISNYLCKINVILIFKFGIIFLLSTSYYITTMITTSKMKNNYNDFDSIIEEINVAYSDYFKIFLLFKDQIDIIEKTENYSLFNIPEDYKIERPKLGKALIYIIKSSKYSKDNIEIFETLYNEDACKVLTNNNEEYQICKNILSSILSKGFEQAIVQISSIITSVIDELKSLKENKTLDDLYNNSYVFEGYELFMEYYMFRAYLTTQNIFKEFRIDERKYINNRNKIILLIYCIIYIILFFILLLYIYRYKYFAGAFLSFIGIIPPKYMADDNEFYMKVIGLNPFYS